MARIHIVLAAHLAMCPRAQREADVLQRAGHDVTLSGIWFDERLAEVDLELSRRRQVRFAAALDLRPCRGRWRNLTPRLKRRLARERFRLQGSVTPSLLGYGVPEQLARCLQAQADLTIVHGEPGLWIADQLLAEKRRVGVDFEDWFSRDLLPDQRPVRLVNLLARLEKSLLAHAHYRVASSQVMAGQLARFSVVPLPRVVTNAGQEPASLPPTGSKWDSPLRLHWFSQTIGPGRGLEVLFAALHQICQPVRLTLRGDCRSPHRAWLAAAISKLPRHMLQVLPPIPPWDLPGSIAKHEVGLALETSEIPSRDLCMTNKLFHYLASGLAVIATPTQGQREALAQCLAAGILLPDVSPAALAFAINSYATNRGRLLTARAAAYQAGITCWNGEKDRAAILEEAHQALQKP